MSNTDTETRVRIPRDLHKEARIYAATMGVSISRAMAELVRRGLADALPNKSEAPAATKEQAR
ncbi:MAG: hypothetical protein RBU30_17745 [Polyangia bacterium]|jgi:hypothetical protein|nr:hypothetical protein [Polyangia bacterium]